MVENKMAAFQERIRELRGKKTLQEVSDAIGITRVAMGYYEKGERKPDIDTLYKIAIYYGVSSDYLLGIDSDLSNYEILKNENRMLKEKIAKMKQVLSD